MSHFPSPAIAALLLGLASASTPVRAEQDSRYRWVEGGDFRSSVRYEESTRIVRVGSFALMARPVSNAEFAHFLTRQPQWRRDRVPRLFAGPGYLGHWAGAEGPGSAADANAPVVHVSWYAADAYCREQQARLPTFVEWEYAAAADPTRRDARDDMAWRLRQVNDGSPNAPDAAPGALPNVYGVHGLHGAYWEWSVDHASLLGDGDRRGQQDGNALLYCGATAMNFNDPGDYGVVKRFVLLSALPSAASLGNLGFRCARSNP